MKTVSGRILRGYVARTIGGLAVGLAGLACSDLPTPPPPREPGGLGRRSQRIGRSAPNDDGAEE